ncbi:MAG: class I SAM-dependent methyltransferase [Candidatus Hydrogenedentes bacterium]|nr:class I SAM-dependent methyltransferase [Candidatus Hydrogenedentota bacterium]
MAERLIPEESRSGRILDIGCGTFPLFLASTRFAEKHGLDRVAGPETIARLKEEGISLTHHDVEASATLPYEDKHFDVVTMLAVFEHIEPRALTLLTAEIHRILKPGGVYILTTPNAGTESILSVLSFLGLVSSEEVGEHKDSYSRESVRARLREGGFAADAIQTGLFEFGLNIWARARK